MVRSPIAAVPPASVLTAGGPELGPRLLAGAATILRRNTDRTQLVLGYADGRDEEPVAISLTLDDDPSFPELVARVAAQLAATPAHGKFDLVLAIDRDPPDDSLDGLWLAAHQGSDGLRLVLHGNGSAPDVEGRERMLGQLQTLLLGPVDEENRPISALPILTEAERHQLLFQWNETEAPYPHACLHELFEEQARLNPDRTALSCGEDRLTYGELDARANQLAGHLAALGVGPDVLVGIAVERGLDMGVGLLGILKAGGAYVPVDPTYPVERQAFMLRSSAAPVVVTQERLLADLPLDDVRVVCLDRDWATIAQQPATPPATDSIPDQLAYVIYTSGSTGEPKGVEIAHRSLVNFLTSMSREPGIRADDVLVAVTTLSFDIAGLELYLPLLAGAQVVVAPAAATSDPFALAQLLERSGATIMQATPTTWRMLLDARWTPSREIKALCGGEPLPVALADRLIAAGVELWNMYGPTETTIWSTCKRLSSRGESLTIGRPIANTTLYILDRHLAPVPVGVAGELWIGGDGLAQGYRGRPDLTAERFIPHPFDDRAGRRIYRTGDMASYRPDGEVEFLGRVDNQVKVRGFRVELGEIETALTRHTGVADAIVVARGDTTAEAELAAYVIPVAQDVPAHTLRTFLAETLPAYMIPSTVTTLAAFPLTPNGKVDRKALPEPMRSRSTERELVAPRTTLECQLADIWERELRVSPVSVTDNLFDLGVTSIVAAGLFASIEHELGSRLPLGALFQAPTIETLAALLEAGTSTAERWSSLVPIQPQGTRPPIFCVHGGAGTVLHLAPLARRLGPEQPFYGLQSRGLYGRTAPLRTVEEMATHYLAEMRDVWPSGPWYLGGYCFGALVAFEIALRLQAAGEEVRLLVSFNGPSTAWIRRWGSFGNQPGWQARHPQPPATPTPDAPAGNLPARRRQIARALMNPRRAWSGLTWRLQEPRARFALALGRPLPERARERFFLELHGQAEDAYSPPEIYRGEMMVFYGDGLYDDPELGWESFVSDGVKAYAVPGADRHNRDAMREPAVASIAERLRERLAAE